MKNQIGMMGKKIGMTQVFNGDGTRSGVTAIELGPCFVVQKRTPERDGYCALQVGFEEMAERKASRPAAGHFGKAGIAPQRYLQEFRVSEETAAQYEPGQEIKVADLFQMGDKIDIAGVSKGKGFSGVMRKFDFAGAKATHGVHEAFRHGGSLGQCMTPGRVMKGKKMAGQFGDSAVTIQNIEIMRVFAADNLIFVKGPVPGSRNSLVTVMPAVKKKR